jgi:mRNA interferase MazF
VRIATLGGMAINFYPTAGMVLICDFRDTVWPEICKIRPVVIVSASHLRRARLATVVPLSTTRPQPICAYHFLLRNRPYVSAHDEVWAKCDLVTSVSHSRLTRVRLSPERFVIGTVSDEELKLIRIAAALSFGIDFSKRES